MIVFGKFHGKILSQRAPNNSSKFGQELKNLKTELLSPIFFNYSSPSKPSPKFLKILEHFPYFSAKGSGKC